MKKYTLLLLLLVFSFMIISCGPRFTTLTNDIHAKQGSTIAVLSGLDNLANLQLANYVSQTLQQESSFHVLSQKNIASKIKGYPLDIQGPYSTSYFTIEKDFSQTDHKKLNQIQKKLGVDYLFVLWIPVTKTHNNKCCMIQAITQLYKFPGGQELGRGEFMSAAPNNLFDTEASPDERYEKGMKNVSRYVAMQLTKNTGMLAKKQ